MMHIRNVTSLVKGSHLTRRARELALVLLDAALSGSDAGQLVSSSLRLEDDRMRFGERTLQINELDGVCVVGAGKATGRMTEAVEAILQGYITNGLIIVPQDQVDSFTLKRVRVKGGGHPLPTNEGVAATQELIKMIQSLPENTLILCLISGGGSALLSLPTPPLTLQDLRETTMLLTQSGAPIDAVNIVRKHLSIVKGGHLALMTHPRQLWTLLLSDVPGDKLEAIASGPTLPDSSTFESTVLVLTQYDLWEQLPISVRHHIEKGVSGEIRETPKPDHPAFRAVYNYLIGSNKDACTAALRAALEQGCKARILTTDCEGEARKVGEKLGQLGQKLYDGTRGTPQVLIIGSETTVTVQHKGRGGRNSELVTAAMPYLQDREGLVIASLATDGIDGPTEYAGALADGTSYSRAKQLNYSTENALIYNTTYDLLKVLDDHILTGSTYTNVRDVTVIIAMPPSCQMGNVEDSSNTEI